MTVRRLHADSLPADGGVVVLGTSGAQHVKVLRLKTGDPLLLFDSEGREAKGRIKEIVDDRVTCVCDQPTATRATVARVVLMLALPKGTKVDVCVRMATELSVAEMVLFKSERSVPQWDDARAAARLERLQRIAIEAAEQSERIGVPTVHGVLPFTEALGRVPEGATRLMFGARSGSQVGPLQATGGGEVWCAIGPEGGFSEHEMTLFADAGFDFVSLGAPVLRVETAVAAALAVILDRLSSGLNPR